MPGLKTTVMEIGGKQYPLLLTYNAVCEFDANIGPVTEIFRGVSDSKRFVMWRGLLWAAHNEYIRVNKLPIESRIGILEAGDLCQQYIAENDLFKIKAFFDELQGNSEWLGGNVAATEKNGKTPEVPGASST